LGLLFLILGIVLVVIARKEKGKLKIALIVTGISAVSPLVFTILHNLFYALGIYFEKLNILFEVLHGGSFIIALIVAPIAFLIGIIASFVLMKKKA
jgi:hypothetical protein